MKYRKSTKQTCNTSCRIRKVWRGLLALSKCLVPRHEHVIIHKAVRY